MLMLPPPGYNTTSINQQNNQLLGRPQQQAPMPSSPAMKSATPALSPSPLANMPPQLAYMMKLLGGRH